MFKKNVKNVVVVLLVLVVAVISLTACGSSNVQTTEAQTAKVQEHEFIGKWVLDKVSFWNLDLELARDAEIMQFKEEFFRVCARIEYEFKKDNILTVTAYSEDGDCASFDTEYVTVAETESGAIIKLAEEIPGLSDFCYLSGNDMLVDNRGLDTENPTDTSDQFELYYKRVGR